MDWKVATWNHGLAKVIQLRGDDIGLGRRYFVPRTETPVWLEKGKQCSFWPSSFQPSRRPEATKTLLPEIPST